MKALTICQPYAHLIVTGEKRVENREWPTKYRGPLLIHAGKSRAWLRGEKPTPDMVFGAIVGIAQLRDCAHIDEIDRGRWDSRYPWIRFHDHTEGTWCWILSRVERLAEPVPYRGQLGLFDIEWPLSSNAQANRRSDRSVRVERHVRL